MGFAIFVYPGRSVGRRALIGVVIAVFDPIMRVAMNLVKSPRVWGKRINPHSASTTLVICLLGCDRRSPPKSGGSARTGHIFSLCLTKQTIWLAGRTRQP